MLSPRYAVVLGVAAGFFLVGTVLAYLVLIGDCEERNMLVRPEVRSARNPDGGGALRREIEQQFERGQVRLDALQDQLMDIESGIAQAQTAADSSAGATRMAPARDAERLARPRAEAVKAVAEGEDSIEASSDSAVRAALETFEDVAGKRRGTRGDDRGARGEGLPATATRKVIGSVE